MLPQVAVSRHCCAESTDIENYLPLVGSELLEEIRELSSQLQGLRVCEINATDTGGGVAELLSREIPIYRALGIPTDWHIIRGDKEFFSVTKGFHNALQGAEMDLTPAISEEYLGHNRQSAGLLQDEYDVYVVHDPQPAALPYFAAKNNAKWIWRCHIDNSSPNQAVWEFLRPYIQPYDAAVFTMKEFCPPDLEMIRVEFFPPAIDPFATKNMDLPRELCRKALADSGIDLRWPLLLQVSRFDPWKDPLGVIQAYRLVREARPGVQLALVGAMAGDDPEAWGILETINSQALQDPDIYVFTNLTGVGNMEVNVFQRGSDLVIQKSIREGFGLVVSESLWKAKAVVAGDAGGIPMQFPAGYDDYLVADAEECAEKLLLLLQHPDLAEEFGHAGRENVRKHFLLPRLIRDELKLIHSLVH